MELSYYASGIFQFGIVHSCSLFTSCRLMSVFRVPAIFLTQNFIHSQVRSHSLANPFSSRSFFLSLSLLLQNFHLLSLFLVLLLLSLPLSNYLLTLFLHKFLLRFFSFGYGACDARGAGPVLVVARLRSYFWRAAGSPKVSSAWYTKWNSSWLPPLSGWTCNALRLKANFISSKVAFWSTSRTSYKDVWAIKTSHPYQQSLCTSYMSLWLHDLHDAHQNTTMVSDMIS